MIGRLLGGLLGWIVLGAVLLLVVALALTMLGGACWIALSIWKAVFGFFM